jgi:CheY-like chemotaxis protein
MHLDRVLGKRILLADDQPGVRAAIKFLLQVDEHQVVEARNGKEALDLFRRDSFDLVITDYAMPEMQGSELALTIKRDMPGQPIILITAYTQELGAWGQEVDAVLNKPFSFVDLRAAIAKLLPDRQEVLVPGPTEPGPPG